MDHSNAAQPIRKKKMRTRQQAEPAAKDILIIFAKYPAPGKVKTRLAKEIGKEKAALLYASFVKSIVERTRSRYYKQVIFFSPSNRKKEFKDWLGRDIEFTAQKGSDLGARMADAFKISFSKNAEKVIIIGTDSPHIDNKRIEQAFKMLRKHEAVIGPSQDGGYYLLGLSRFTPKVFGGISWSTDKVFDQSVNILENERISYSILPAGFDIDVAGDLDNINHTDLVKKA
ncbi:TIGR04282 family arsenosugar biosynthesis glycosyltransferase [Candidatus Omnitrophota bacterium]